jgi:hypothetical protein
VVWGQVLCKSDRVGLDRPWATATLVGADLVAARKRNEYYAKNQINIVLNFQIEIVYCINDLIYQFL